MGQTEETLRYYDAHASLAAAESLKHQDRQALHAFLKNLPPSARVLDAGCGAGADLSWFREHGLQAEGFDGSAKLVEMARVDGLSVSQKDFRLLSLPKESLDGIWCNRALVHLSIEDCQRVLASFFQALKPRTGMLFVTILEGSGTRTDPGNADASPKRTFHRFGENAFLSLLRQSGFQLLMKGERKEALIANEAEEKWLAIIARRV